MTKLGLHAIQILDSDVTYTDDAVATVRVALSAAPDTYQVDVCNRYAVPLIMGIPEVSVEWTPGQFQDSSTS